LAETVRRNRATGGPAEATFATLVGLELRPRRMRDAANLWAALREASDADGRDAVWAHPDLLPTAADLDDPLGFTTDGTETGDDSDFDSALAELLDSQGGPAAAGPGAGEQDQPPTDKSAAGEDPSGEDPSGEVDPRTNG